MNTVNSGKRNRSKLIADSDDEPELDESIAAAIRATPTKPPVTTIDIAEDENSGIINNNNNIGGTDAADDDLQVLAKKYPSVKRQCIRVTNLGKELARCRDETRAASAMLRSTTEDLQGRLDELNEQLRAQGQLIKDLESRSTNMVLIALEKAAAYNEESHAWQRLYDTQRSAAETMFRRYVRLNCNMPECDNEAAILLHTVPTAERLASTVDMPAGHYVCFSCFEGLLTAAASKSVYSKDRTVTCHPTISCPMCREPVSTNFGATPNSCRFAGVQNVQASWVLPTVRSIQDSVHPPAQALDEATEQFRIDLLTDIAAHLRLPHSITKAIQDKYQLSQVGANLSGSMYAEQDANGAVVDDDHDNNRYSQRM